MADEDARRGNYQFVLSSEDDDDDDDDDDEKKKKKANSISGGAVYYPSAFASERDERERVVFNQL